LQHSHATTISIIALLNVAEADSTPILLRFENRSNQACRISNAHHSAQQIQPSPSDQNLDYNTVASPSPSAQQNHRYELHLTNRNSALKYCIFNIG
jgi:hypothetical protein